MKTDLFQSCGHCWVFHVCRRIECSTFTASSFRIWNSSTGIPLPPLALFLVMLPKAHLTLDSRISGSTWVITPLWLPGSWRSFLYSSSVYSCHLFLISSASVRCIPFVLYWAHLCMKCSLGISNFLEEISSLSHSIPILLFPIVFYCLQECMAIIEPNIFCTGKSLCYTLFSPVSKSRMLHACHGGTWISASVPASWGWTSLPVTSSWAIIMFLSVCLLRAESYMTVALHIQRK